MQKRNSYRATQFQTREEESGDLVLSGYFIKFDEETELWRGYHEVIKRAGVEKAVTDADIRALFNPQLFTPNLKTIQNPCLSLDPGWFLFSPNGCFLLDK
ncbi:HK97 family phage prohead protease, partial [Streptococcus pneumoniae]|nr:HK97 family phage prohead protease [Streptococcus pneumoniae]